MAAELTAHASVVVGVTKLAWMYGKSRDWAESLLKEWHDQQRLGTGPVRVFQQGKRGSLFTTMAVIHASMPPGRDLALYKRMKDVEEEVREVQKRLDREVLERKQVDAEMDKRVSMLESRRRSA